MAGVSVQQQPERHSGRRDGTGQDDSDDCPHHLPDGEQEEPGPFPDYCAAVDSVQLGARVREVGAVRQRRVLQGVADRAQDRSESDEGRQVQHAAHHVRVRHQG